MFWTVLLIIAIIISAFLTKNEQNSFKKFLFWAAVIIAIISPIVSYIEENNKSKKIIVLEKNNEDLYKQKDLLLTKINEFGNRKEKYKKTIALIESRAKFTSLADSAISANNREAYLELKYMAKPFTSMGNAAKAEMYRVKTFHHHMTSVSNITLDTNIIEKGQKKTESMYTPEELIEIMLFNSSSQYRARSAQLLAKTKDKAVFQSLLLVMFSDINMEVVKEAKIAFAKLAGLKNSDYFDGYEALGWWYDNYEKYDNSLNRKPINSIIPWERFNEKMNNLIITGGFVYLTDKFFLTKGLMVKFINQK